MSLLRRKPQPHELRIQVLNPAGMTPDDEMMVDLMRRFPPRTELRTGDLCQLTEVPYHLSGEGPYPNIWEVRAVYSRWQQMLHDIVHQNPGMLDWAVVQIELSTKLPPNRYRDPVVYAHAYPHGQWPSSAEFFPEYCLRKLPLVAPTEDWAPILDEFSSPFVGYDPKNFGAGVVIDLAPDIYGDQRQRRRPLCFEEESFHVACLLGLEETCMVPAANADLRHDIINYDDRESEY